MRGQCRSLLCGRFGSIYSYHHHQTMRSHTNLKCNHHRKQSSMPEHVDRLQWSLEYWGYDAAKSDCQGQHDDDDDDDDGSCNAAEYADNEGCWLAGVCLLQCAGMLSRLVITCHRPCHVWLSVAHVCTIFLLFMLSLIRCRSESRLWFMSESCSPRCCRRGTLTRESYWLFVLSIIREYIQFTPFITLGPSDKWWAGVF